MTAKQKKKKEIKRAPSFSQSPRGNAAKTRENTEEALLPLFRQKADFSVRELQELQQKLERWVQEAQASRLFSRGLRGFSREGLIDDESVSGNNDGEDDWYGGSEVVRK